MRGKIATRTPWLLPLAGVAHLAEAVSLLLTFVALVAHVFAPTGSFFLPFGALVTAVAAAIFLPPAALLAVAGVGLLLRAPWAAYLALALDALVILGTLLLAEDGEPLPGAPLALAVVSLALVGVVLAQDRALASARAPAPALAPARAEARLAPDAHVAPCAGCGLPILRGVPTCPRCRAPQP